MASQLKKKKKNVFDTSCVLLKINPAPYFLKVSGAKSSPSKSAKYWNLSPYLGWGESCIFFCDFKTKNVNHFF
jgi:hypothetical protein